MVKLMITGAVLAAAAGYGIGNTLLGVAIGAAIGACFGAAFWALSRMHNEP